MSQAWRYDPATVDLAVELCQLGRVTEVLGLGMCAGESDLQHSPANPDGTPKRGDNGRACGLIQMRYDVHGGPPERWEGLDGARASLLRAIHGTSAPKWRVALVEYVREHGPWDGTVAWFRGYWMAAQGMITTPSLDHATRALAMGREAWAEYQARHAAPQEDPVSTPAPMLRRKAVPRPPIREYWAHPNNYTAAAQRADGGLAAISLEGMTGHTSGGGATIQALIAWFQNPNQRDARGNPMNVSTRFGIGPDEATGEIWFVQFVRDEDLPHSQSLGSNPTAPLVLENLALGYANPSAYLDGCELTDAGVPGNHSIAQLDAFAWLTAWRFDTRYFEGGASGVEVSRHNIIGHYEVSDDRQLCPNFTPQEWEYVVRKVNEWLYEEAAAPEDPRDAVIGSLKGQIITLRDDLTVIRDDYDRWAEAATEYAEHATKTAAHLSGIIAGL